MMKCVWLCVWLSCSLVSLAQNNQYRIVFYNVENLFDTRDDFRTSDQEFTPAGANYWTESRYKTKQSKIAETLRAAGGRELPLFIGLAEVENRLVVDDLIRQTALLPGKYGVVHQDSPDERGIDVAFLYRKALFKPLQSGFLKVTFPTDTTDKTRDILYVSGLLGVDTLHFFVCHFPSMSGGEKKSEWKRICAAQVLRHKADSVRTIQPGAKIIIMGDFNGKADTDAQKMLGTKSSDQAKYISDSLYNTGYYLLSEKYGSYRYRGVWQTLDHVIVSGSLLNARQGVRTGNRLTVFSAPFLLEEDKKYSGNKPRPTYRGPIYIGGYSDHLPVYLDLRN